MDPDARTKEAEPPAVDRQRARTASPPPQQGAPMSGGRVAASPGSSKALAGARLPEPLALAWLAGSACSAVAAAEGSARLALEAFASRERPSGSGRGATSALPGGAGELAASDAAAPAAPRGRCLTRSVAACTAATAGRARRKRHRAFECARLELAAPSTAVREEKLSRATKMAEFN